tara:strand:- start:149 stop:607 length:459 start_codon:yes stop_codon:yes gene_type:complete
VVVAVTHLTVVLPILVALAVAAVVILVLLVALAQQGKAVAAVTVTLVVNTVAAAAAGPTQLVLTQTPQLAATVVTENRHPSLAQLPLEAVVAVVVVHTAAVVRVAQAAVATVQLHTGLPRMFRTVQLIQEAEAEATVTVTPLMVVTAAQVLS